MSGMSSPNVHPSSSVTYTQGGSVFQGNVSASRDINIINHVSTIRPLASCLSKGIFSSSELSCHIKSDLHYLITVLDATEKQVWNSHGKDPHNATLSGALQSCHEILLDLSHLEEHICSAERPSQANLDQSCGDVDKLTDIRTRLSSCTQLLTFFNTERVLSSQSNLETTLMTFIEEIRRGKRRSVASNMSQDSLSMEEKTAWRELRKELQGVGITPEVFARNRLFILTALQQAISQDQIEDYKTKFDSTIPDHGIPSMQTDQELQDDSYNGKHASTSTTKAILVEMAPSNQDPQRATHCTEAYITSRLKRGPNARKFPYKRLWKCFLEENTEVHQAATSGDVEKVKKLLKSGVDVNQLSKELRMTALWLAVNHGHKNVVDVLLASGANANISCLCISPLEEAQMCGFEEIVQVLQRHGAKYYPEQSIDYVVRRKMLTEALCEGWTAIARLILEWD